MKKLHTFTIHDQYELTEEAILSEAQCCAKRSAEVFGWINVEARRNETKPYFDRHYKVYTFDIFGTDTKENDPYEKVADAIEWEP